MEATDLTTYGGVVAGTMFLIEVIKKLFIKNDFEIKSKPWYPVALNFVTMAIAIGLSLFAYYFIVEEPIPGYDIKTALYNGIIAGLVTTGLYEPIVNSQRGLKRKANK